MIKGKIKGFAYEIDERALDDYELLEDVARVEESPNRTTAMVTRILGKEQVKRLKDHCRDKDGWVSAAKMSELFCEILDDAQEKSDTVKNS